MASTRCLGRLVDDKKTGFFGNGKNKFHLELRCEKMATDVSGLCIKCQQRPREMQKNHPPLLHGYVNGPIPAWSHVFGSAWYESKVSTMGKPSEEEMAKAKKAREEARKDLEQTQEPKEVILPAVVEKSVNEKPKKRSAKKVEIPAAPTSIASEPVEKKKRASKAKIKIVEQSSLQPLPQDVPTVAVESLQPTLEGLEVVRIRVKKIEHDGVEYYLDSNKCKLYSVGGDKKPSAYVGRWDPQAEVIDREFPDSDAE
jgi:hypothetical protein